MSDLNKYLDEGFLLKNKLLDRHICQEIINYIDTKNSVVNIPFSNVGWGYGNLIEDERMEIIKNHNFILEFCISLLGENFVFNHLMINNKAPWIGPDVEWHQKYLILIPMLLEEMKMLIVGKITFRFTTLDPHTLENGCLKIIPNSHKLGLLPHEDIVNSFFNHKEEYLLKL